MSTRFPSAILLLGLGALPGALAAPPPAPAGFAWKEVFADGFDAWDDAKWWKQVSWVKHHTYWTAEDAWVAGGNLVLRARKGAFNGADGRGGYVSSRGLWNNAY